MPDSLTVPSRFNGPLESGNGGYSAGLVAQLLGGAAEVNLRSPVPLDRALEVERQDDGSARVLDGERLVMEGRAVRETGVELPDPVSPEQARLATERYRGAPDAILSRCFVCGLERDDSFEVFAGEVDGRELVASPWTPPAWTADERGRVRPEFVWAVLDCPTYFAAYMRDAGRLSMLAQLTAELRAPARAGEEHVVIAWPLETDGRKRYAGSAVFTAAGEPIAAARALNVELRA